MGFFVFLALRYPVRTDIEKALFSFWLFISVLSQSVKREDKSDDSVVNTMHSHHFCLW